MTAVFEHNKKYRVWSLAGQGFLKLTTKNGAKSAECSGIGNEPESIIIAKDVKHFGKGARIKGFWLHFQEGNEKTYALDTVAGDVSVKALDDGEGEIFQGQLFGSGSGCFFKALMPLGQDNDGKCIASNSQRKWSLKTFDQHSPHPDTIFLITKVSD